ncbi:MAG: recombinase family protein [Pseudomonadota bacterium]
MNDFLQSLRNGTLKRQDRNRKNFDKPQYRNGERGGNRDKRNGNLNKPVASPELGEIKTLLQSLNDNTELARIAQERAAEALERIARSLQAMAPDAKDLMATAPATPPSLKNETAPEPLITADTCLEDVSDGPEGDDARAGTVATIRNMRNDGSSFEAIAQYLNARAVPTFSGKGGWRAQNVSRAYNAACNGD